MSTSAVSNTTTIATQATRQQPDLAQTRAQENNRSAEIRPQNGVNVQTEQNVKNVEKVEEPKPTVNTSGQTIGTRINTTA